MDEGIDQSLLPPCRSSLQMHIMRANYVAYLWKHSHISHPQMPSAVGSGWKLNDAGNIEIEWNCGDIMPIDLIEVMVPADEGEERAEEDVDENLEESEQCEIDNIIDIVFDEDDDV